MDMGWMWGYGLGMNMGWIRIYDIHCCSPQTPDPPRHPDLLGVWGYKQLWERHKGDNEEGQGAMGNWGRLWGDRGLQKPLGGGAREAYGAIISCGKVLEYMGL